MASSTISSAVMFRRAHSKAAQLCTGLARLELTAYRVDAHSSLDVLASGFDSQGNLIVALARPLQEGAQDVRLTITGHAPHLERRVVAASLHGLGTLEPFELDYESIFEGTINQMMLNEDTHLYILKLSKCLLHDASGVVHINVAAAADLAWNEEQLSSFEVAETSASADQDLLKQLAEAVVQREIAGIVWDERELPAGICDQVSETLILDLNASGVTLMLLHDGVSQSIFAAFEDQSTEKRGVNDVRAALNGLLAKVWMINASRATEIHSGVFDS